MLPSAINNVFRVFLFVFLYTAETRILESQSIRLRDISNLIRSSQVVYLSDLQSRDDDESADYTADSRNQDLSLSVDDRSDDQESYLLYALIKTAQEKEDMDSDTEDKLENTKDILRSKLIGRCAKLDTCKQQCPPKKKNNCEEKCEDIYDAEDVCEETTTTCKPTTTTCRTSRTTKCRGTGKTMPPRWCKGQ